MYIAKSRGQKIINQNKKLWKPAKADMIFCGDGLLSLEMKLEKSRERFLELCFKKGVCPNSKDLMDELFRTINR